MSIWYPRFPLRHLPAMLRMAMLGAVLAGIYGAVHDQISYSISPEYFTKLKFHQFASWDFGWPPRLFAALVGFLASWWVGLIGGWILARVGLAELAEVSPRHHFIRAFALAAGIAAICGVLGVQCGLAMSRRANLAGWQEWQSRLELEDLPAFIVVAYLHWASYLGAALGLFSAVIYVKRARATLPVAQELGAVHQRPDDV